MGLSPGAITYDGKRMIMISPKGNLAGHARLFVWNEGTREPVASRLLEFPASRICDPKEGLAKLNIVDNKIESDMGGLLEIRKIWACNSGLLLRCSSNRADAQALMFITWSELGLPPP